MISAGHVAKSLRNRLGGDGRSPQGNLEDLTRRKRQRMRPREKVSLSGEGSMLPFRGIAGTREEKEEGGEGEGANEGSKEGLRRPFNQTKGASQTLEPSSSLSLFLKPPSKHPQVCFHCMTRPTVPVVQSSEVTREARHLSFFEEHASEPTWSSGSWS